MARKNTLSCPKCKNKDFVPSKDVPRPVNTYKTETFSTIRYRYNYCLQCGHKWRTKEVYDKIIEAITKARKCLI